MTNLSQIHSRKCLIVVGALVIDQKVLMVYHPKLKIWLAPGGHVEPTETPDQALVREFKEEVGLNVAPVNFTPIQSDNLNETLALPFHVDLHSIDQGNCQQHVTLAYYVELTDENREVSPQPGESERWGWFANEEVEKLDTRPNVKKIAQLAIESYPKIIFRNE